MIWRLFKLTQAGQLDPNASGVQTLVVEEDCGDGTQPRCDNQNRDEVKPVVDLAKALIDLQKALVDLQKSLIHMYFEACDSVVQARYAIFDAGYAIFDSREAMIDLLHAARDSGNFEAEGLEVHRWHHRSTRCRFHGMDGVPLRESKAGSSFMRIGSG